MKISFIIPVYNAEKYIARCLDSIYSQTVRDFEVIVIDDGSTDSSINICKQYKSYGIQIIKQQNSGVSVARNTGLQAAKGEYICFVDADDYISECLIEVTYKLLNQYDIILFGYKEGTESNFKFKKESITSYKTIDTDLKGIKLQCLYPTYSELKNTNFRPASSWCKLYNRLFLLSHNIRFEKNVINSEDAIFNLQTLKHTKSIIRITNILYYYFTNDNNSGNRFIPNLPNRIDTTWQAFINNTNDCYTEEEKSRIKLREFSYIQKLISQYYFHKNNPDSIFKLIKLLRKEIEQNKYQTVITTISPIGLSPESKIYLYLLRHKQYTLLLLYIKLKPALKIILQFCHNHRSKK